MSDGTTTPCKRSFEREQLLNAVAMVWDADNTPPLECVCRDVSESGIMIEAKDTQPEGKRLRVSLHNHVDKTHIGTVKTQVVRSQKNKCGTYNIGLEILSDDKLTKIQQQELEGEKKPEQDK